MPAAPDPLPHPAISIGAGLLVFVLTLPLVATDLHEHLLPWFDHIVAAGPVGAFARPFSNYSPAYLYLLAAVSPLSAWVAPAVLIKTLSLAGTATLALAVRRLLVGLRAPQPDRGAALVFVLPTVAINAGLLGQCDAMWAAPSVMALAAAVERRHGAMLAWCGLALGFKAQAVLVAPFFLALLVNRRVPLPLWPIAPAVAAATMLPAWAAGWPASDLATIYLRQADSYTALSLNAPNLWAIVQALPPGETWLPALACTAALGATAGYIAWFAAAPLGDRALLPAALLAPLLTAGLLPRMHERYFFLADVLALILALTLRDRTSWRIALLIQAGSMLGIAAWTMRVPALAMLGALPMIAATILLARRLVQPAQRPDSAAAAASMSTKNPIHIASNTAQDNR